MTDFTIRKNNRDILLFLIPLILSGAFQSLYSLINAGVVGRVISSDAVAVIGACSSMNTLISHVFGGMAAGISVYLGRCIGTGDSKNIGKAFCGAIDFLLIMMIPAAGAAAFPKYPALAMNISEQLLPQACLYLRFLFIGAFFVALKGLLIGLLQGFGDSRIIGLLSILSVVTQTLLVVLLVGGLHMGVEGSALAIILNNLLFCLIYGGYSFYRYKERIPFFRPDQIDSVIYGELLHNAVAKTSMMLIIWIGSFAFSRQINNLSSDLIAAHTYVRSLYSVFVEIVSAFGTAAAVMIGQNFGTGGQHGKENAALILIYSRVLLIGSLLTSLLITLIFVVFGKTLYVLVSGVSASDEIVAAGVLLFRIIGCGFPGLAVLLVGRYGLQAMGYYKIQPVLGVIETIVNITCSRFVSTYGVSVIGWCTFLKWVIPGLVAGAVFFFALRQERKVELNGHS